jgi:hypothetical protein
MCGKLPLLVNISASSCCVIMISQAASTRRHQMIAVEHADTSIASSSRDIRYY